MKISRVKTGLVMAFVIAAALVGCGSTGGTTDVTITIASNTLQNVVRVTDNKFRKNAVRVSPDGKMLLYCEANETNPNTQLYLEDYRIMLLRDHATSSAKTPLTTEPSYGPAWFDDNNGFAYIAYEGNGSNLVKSNISGGGKTYITRTSAGEADANPHISGNLVLIDTLIGGRRQLVTMRDNLLF